MKKLIFSLFSVFLGYRSYQIILALIAKKATDFNFPEEFAISFMLTLFVTGIFAFPGFAIPTSKLLPNSYYQIKNPKRLNQIYHLLGVNYFRSLLLIFYYNKKKPRKKFFNSKRNGISKFSYQTKQSEFGHLGAFITISLCSIVLLVHNFYFMVLLIMLINTIGNLFPVVLQRYHRMRIDQLLKNQ